MTVAITVNPANDAPVAVADSATVARGRDGHGAVVRRRCSVLANDTDADERPLTAVLVSGPANGELDAQWGRDLQLHA